MIYTITLNPAIDKEYEVSDLAFNKVLRANDIQVDCGGKGLNVSRMLKSLGTESTAIGFIGGQTGELLQSGIEKLGIQTDFVKIKDESRTNISIVEKSRKRHIKLNESGPCIGTDEIQNLLNKVWKHAKPRDYWILAGSQPPGVPNGIYAKIIQILNEKGAYTILDSSGEPLRLGCLAKPHLVKPNSVEARELTGFTTNSIDGLIKASAKIHQMGVKVVVISAGAKGAIISDGSEYWFGHSPIIEEHNPIGSGDAMLAGIVWKLSRAGDLKTALCWGLACGAAAASQPGSKIATRKLINDLFRKTSLDLVRKV